MSYQLVSSLQSNSIPHSRSNLLIFKAINKRCLMAHPLPPIRVVSHGEPGWRELYRLNRTDLRGGNGYEDKNSHRS